MTRNPFDPPKSDVGGASSSLSRQPRPWHARCPVCGQRGISRLRAIVAPRCSECGCRVRQNMFAGLATHLVSSVLLYLSIAVSISYLTVLPMLVGFGLSAAMVSTGAFVANKKDPETRIRMRMQELKARATRDDESKNKEQ